MYGRRLFGQLRHARGGVHQQAVYLLYRVHRQGPAHAPVEAAGLEGSLEIAAAAREDDRDPLPRRVVHDIHHAGERGEVQQPDA